MQSLVRSGTRGSTPARLSWRRLHRLWWLVFLIALPVAAGLELQTLNSAQSRYDDVAVQLESLRSEVNQAAANVGWDVALHAPVAGVESELSSLRAQIAAGLIALQTNPVDAASVKAITASTGSLMDTLSATVGVQPAPGAAISLVQQHNHLVALVDAYAAKIAGAAAQADSLFGASVWVVVLAESVLLGVALWYGLAQRRRVALQSVKHDSLRQLGAVVENAPVVAFALDLGGRLTFLQGRALDEAGIRPADLVGRSMLDLFGDREDVKDARSRILAGEHVQVQLEFFSRMWDVHGSLVHPANGGAPVILGVAQDVTELVASQQALRSSEERFRALVQNASDLISVIGADGTIKYVSRAVDDFGDAGSEAYIGKGLEVVLEEDRPGLAAVTAELMRHPDAVRRARFRFQHHDGTVHWAESIARNALADPAVNGIVVNTRDITDVVRSQEALQVSEERFRELVQQSSDMTSIFSADGQRTYLSPAVQDFYGVPLDQAPPDWLEHVHPEDRERVAAVLHDVRDHPGATATFRCRLRRPDGGLREVEARIRNALDHPAVRGIVFNTRDVTDAARAQSLLATQARILTMIAAGSTLQETLIAITAVVMDHLPDARCVIQLLGVDGALEVSAAVSRDDLACAYMEGQPLDASSICAAALMRDTALLVEHPADDSRWGAAACLTHANAVEECWVTPIRRDPQGEPVGVLSCYFPRPYTPDEAARQVVLTACELAAVAIDRRRFEDRLSHQALHDDLTGLPNRALLVENIRGDIARASRAATIGALLFIDLDRFKFVNDSLGHASGDYVLQEIAKRIAAEVRTEDTVARLGGDEFVVSCPDIRDDQESIRLAQRLLRAICGPLVVRAQELRLTASIGIAIRHGAEPKVDALLRNADAAMYRAKDRGRDRWEVFDTSLRKRAVERVRTESALRRAVEAGDFDVWYQPVWSLSQQRVASVEALVRWKSAGGRMVSPATFIPLAEETGLISKLGAWVLARACADGALLDREGIVVPHIAVNASARQLTDGSLVAAVGAALAAADWDPRRLTLEVTESAIVGGGAALETLAALRALHVTVALDDFGTGFSSMSLLKRVRYVDVIKIDRSFVTGLGDRDSADHAIVRATIALAEAVGATIVAEGVETTAQLDALTSLGCDLIQGYLVARPMPLSQLRTALVEQPWRAALQAAGAVPPALAVVAGF